MRVLVACEYSGVVRDAFLRAGHEAMSCDLLPTDAPGPHYQGDVRDHQVPRVIEDVAHVALVVRAWGVGRKKVLDYPWDLMIAHPPCTDLSVSGARHFAAKRMDGRQQAGASFVMMLGKRDIPRIAIENPVSVLSSIWCKPDQVIQPWMFGHGDTAAPPTGQP